MSSIPETEKVSSFVAPKFALSGYLVNPSVDYADNHVNEELHPGLSDSGFEYDPKEDRFAARRDSAHDEEALLSCQRGFAKALMQYEENVDPKYKTGIDFKRNHTWEEVIEKVESARNEYCGVDKKGYLKRIRNGLRSFSTAAPAVQAWLSLLPSDSIYASVLCGGISLILGAAVRLGKLREDTFDALDQIPNRIEKAEMFIRTYHGNLREQAADLYQAILEALQHILSWYKKKAGVKFFGAFCQGPAYASTLREKMKMVEDASQAMNNEAGMKLHLRLKEIRNVAWDTKSQLNSVEKRTEELTVLALEARNHLYAVFRDAELWREVVQNFVNTGSMNGAARRGSRSRSSAIRERDALLLELNHDPDALLRDVDDARHELNAFRLGDQDRAAAIIEHAAVQRWIVQRRSQALLIHGNCRRDEKISPTSAASAMLIHVFSNSVPVITLFWFCGSRINGPNGNASGMVRSLICQLLSTSFAFDIQRQERLNSPEIGELIGMFVQLLGQLPVGTAVICLVDGISFYEGSHQREDTCKTIRKIAKTVEAKELMFKLLVTSPLRTHYIHKDPKISKLMELVEIPQHVDGPRQGFSRLSVSTMEHGVRSLSDRLQPGERRSQ